MNVSTAPALTDLATATPVEIDTLLDPIERRISQLWHTFDETVGAETRATKAGRAANAEKFRKDAEQIADQIEQARKEAAPYRAEYDRRYWTRAYKVPSGHVHRTDQCQTCHRQGLRTTIVFIPEWSGRDMAEIVEAAGEGACTVCYPAAPVATRNQPCTILTDGERKDAQAAEERRQDREAKAAKKAAAAITAPDGTPLRTDRQGLIKTLAAAQMEWVDLATNADGLADSLTADHLARIIASDDEDRAVISAAIAAKLGITLEEVAALMAPKVERRRKANAKAIAAWTNRNA